jgi:hypothetical protein
MSPVSLLMGVMYNILSSLHTEGECFAFNCCSDEFAVFDAVVWVVSCFLDVLFLVWVACAAMNDVK